MAAPTPPFGNNAVPFQNNVGNGATTPFMDKVIQDLDPTSSSFGQVDYLHYDGSTLVASYDTTQVNSNFALFQPIVADYFAGGLNGAPVSPNTGGPITVSTGNEGTATTDLALITQADRGGPVDFVYLNDPGKTGFAGDTVLASWQDATFVPEVHGESYALVLPTPGGVPPGNTPGSSDITLVSQETNGTIDLLGYDITEANGGGVTHLVATDEVGSLANPNVPFRPIGEVVGVADTPNNGTIIVAQDNAGHLEFMHIGVGTANIPGGATAPTYVVDSFTITSGTYAPVHDVNPDGVIGSAAPPVPWGPPPSDQLDLVATLTTGTITQIQELYFDVTFNGAGTGLTATNGQGSQAASIVEQNALPAGWQPVDGGIAAAQHFGDVFNV